MGPPRGAIRAQRTRNAELAHVFRHLGSSSSPSTQVHGGADDVDSAATRALERSAVERNELANERERLVAIALSLARKALVLEQERRETMHDRPGERRLLLAFAVAYVGLIAFTFTQALRGQPFIP